MSTPAISNSSISSRSTLLALAAILLWASLASMGVRVSHVPPFLLTGLALLIGSSVGLVLARGDVRRWRVAPRTMLLGVVGLFGFHFLLFLALRLAPPVRANLVNYLWPLNMVLFAPLVLPAARLTRRHVLAGALGFAGASLAILGGAGDAATASADGATGGAVVGYTLALGSSMVWALYSLLCKRVAPFPTAAIGGFAFVSGVLALLCSVLLEGDAWQLLNANDVLLIAIIGLGPLGAAFYFWDAALKTGDAQRIGVLAFMTPLLSTLLLSLTQHQVPSAGLWLAAGLIMLASWIAR